MKRIVFTLILVVVVSTLAVCRIPSIGTAAQADDNSQSAVQTLMDKRTQAIRNGDKQAFLSTVDPQATSTFRNAQAGSFDGWSSIPLQTLLISARTDDSGDLAPGLQIASKHHADAAYMPETRVTYQLVDYEDRPSYDSQWLSYIERSGTWYVAADDDAAEIGLDSNRELWDFGQMATQKTQHFLVITHTDQTDRGAALAGIAEDAMGSFQSRWSEPWSARLPLLIAGSAAETKAVLRTAADVTNFSAFTTYTPYRDSSGWHTTAPRVYAQDVNLSAEPRSQQVDTLVHELTHAATANLEGPYTPIWEHEGIAEWTRLDRPAAVSPPAGVAPTLPAASAFTSGNATDLNNAYVLATSAAAFMDEQKGPSAPLDLFKQVGVMRSVPGSSSYNLNVAFTQSLDESLGDFVSKWNARYPR